MNTSVRQLRALFHRPAAITAAVTAVAAATGITAGGVVSMRPADATAAKPSCAITSGWGSLAKTATPMSRDAVYNVRTGQHPCFDRVVFDVNGPSKVGYTVRYVPVVLSDGAGAPVPVAGGAALGVGLRAPDFAAAGGGHQPGRTPWTTGMTLANSPQWAGIRQVKFAGGFEGYSQFAVGTRARLPFRVTTWTNAGYTHVIVDVAHRWS